MDDEDGFPHECQRCNASGEIGIYIGGRLIVTVKEKPGPVPDDARGWVSQTCPKCLGVGYVVGDE